LCLLASSFVWLWGTKRPIRHTFVTPTCFFSSLFEISNVTTKNIYLPSRAHRKSHLFVAFAEFANVGCPGRPRDADLHARVLTKSICISTRNGYECENIGPDFWDPPTQKGDHFPVTVFKPSLKKTQRKSKVAQILGPENGHVSGTEGLEKRAPELPGR